MFDAMSSLTGGGGLSSAATADGDNTFSNAFSYIGGSAAPQFPLWAVFVTGVVVGGLVVKVVG